ncbi:transposase [Mesorhizobium sp. M0933]|uniref:transposase n=1 Tax=Mesorhizobium sp. M0933 TaxID=2957030 RepID=UPI003338002B
MAGGSSRRASRHPVLSRRLHAAGAHCRHRLSEQGTRLRPALSRYRGDVADDRRRPPTSRRRDRFLRRAAHLGAKFAHHPHLHCVVPSGGFSPDRTRWIACKPLLPAGPRALTPVATIVSEHLAKAFDAGQLKFLL